MTQFIEKSMACLQASKQKGIVQLLSTFLDRFEGKKDFSVELAQQKVTSLKPNMVTVTNFLDTNNITQVVVPIGYY